MNDLAKTKQSSLSVMINIIIPTLLLVFSKKWSDFTPITILIVALMFPLTFMIVEFIKTRHYSLMSLLGFVSVLLTGGIALLSLPPKWIAVKEALIPFIIGCGVMVTVKSNKPAICFVVELIFDIEKIKNELLIKKCSDKFQPILKKATVLLSLSFLLSTLLNFMLAFVVVKSAPGTDAFNKELGLLTVLSYPVIVIPSMLMMLLSVWYFISKIKSLTQLTFQELVNDNLKEKTA